MIDEQLRTPAEQIAQQRIAVFGREPVVLLNPHPGQLTPPARQFVATPRQPLLGLEQPDRHGPTEVQVRADLRQRKQVGGGGASPLAP